MKAGFLETALWFFWQSSEFLLGALTLAAAYAAWRWLT